MPRIALLDILCILSCKAMIDWILAYLLAVVFIVYNAFVLSHSSKNLANSKII